MLTHMSSKQIERRKGYGSNTLKLTIRFEFSVISSYSITFDYEKECTDIKTVCL